MMLLSTQIALACDGLNIHTQLLDGAINANGFASVDSYAAVELEAAERRLRSLADRIAGQRKRLVENKPVATVHHLIAAE